MCAMMIEKLLNKAFEKIGSSNFFNWPCVFFNTPLYPTQSNDIVVEHKDDRDSNRYWSL